MDFTVRPVRLGDPVEAEQLAAMWNASDVAWPGGWTGGVAVTAERMLDRLRDSHCLQQYVAEAAGEVVGYASLMPATGRSDLAYLALLNVRPDHHGRGMGKALILACLDCVVAGGFDQLALHTWSGNLRAVPLYKKMGFYWEPDTNGHMSNFLPAILRHPLAASFFSRHAWPEAFRRELETAPDDEKWEGLHVYAYHFEAGGERLSVWIDRHAEAIAAIETDELLVAAITTGEEVICGLPQTVRWRVVNKRRGRPLAVRLAAAGEDGIDLRVERDIDVEDQVELTAAYLVDPDQPRRPPGLPAPRIRSEFAIGALTAPLACGVRAVQPIEVAVNGQEPVAGKPRERVVLTLRNRLDRPLTGDVSIEPCDGLEFDRWTSSFTVAARSWTSCTVHLTAAEGVHPTHVQARCSGEENPGLEAPGGVLKTKRWPVVFRTVPLFGMVHWEDTEQEAVCLETPDGWVWIRRRGGSISIHDRASERGLVRIGPPALGPPFLGWHWVDPLYECGIEYHNGTAVVTLVVTQAAPFDAAVEFRLTVGGGPLFRLDHRIVNRGDRPLEATLQIRASSPLGQCVTVPLTDGPVHHRRSGWGDFPIGHGDLPSSPEAYREGWHAEEDHPLVAGLVFGACAERELDGLKVALPAIPPGEAHDAEPVYVVAGRGDWELVRRYWRWLYQPSEVVERHRPTCAAVLDAGFATSPLLLAARETVSAIQVRHRRGKALSGSWTASMPGLRITPESGDLSGVDRDHPVDIPVTVVSDDPTPRAERGTLTINDGVERWSFELPAVVVGDASRAVRLTMDDDGRFVVDNGCLRFAVAAPHLGSLCALSWRGAEQVHSSWPEPCPHGWLNPWFGGLHPFVSWPGRAWLPRERFHGRPTRVVGALGLRWSGVHVACDLVHADEQWLRIETEYLTCAGSNLVAVRQRAVNTTPALRWFTGGLALWPQVAGGVADNVLLYPTEEPYLEPGRPTRETRRLVRARARGPFGFEAAGKPWVAVRSGTTGESLLIVPAQPQPGDAAGFDDEGELGVQLLLRWRSRLEPEETVESLAWLVLLEAGAHLEDYLSLARVEALP